MSCVTRWTRLWSVSGSVAVPFRRALVGEEQAAQISCRDMTNPPDTLRGSGRACLGSCFPRCQPDSTPTSPGGPDSGRLVDPARAKGAIGVACQLPPSLAGADRCHAQRSLGGADAVVDVEQ